MPVVTRSQRKKEECQKKECQKKEECYKKLKDRFNSKLVEYLKHNEQAIGEENKMRYALETYKHLNEMFPQFISEECPDKYRGFLQNMLERFSITVFNKSIKLLTEHNDGKWECISDRVLVKEMLDEISKSNVIILPLISSKIAFN